MTQLDCLSLLFIFNALASEISDFLSFYLLAALLTGYVQITFLPRRVFFNVAD